MNYVGIDIGSTASKVVALGDKNIEFVLPTGWSSKETVDEIKNRLLNCKRRLYYNRYWWTRYKSYNCRK